MGGLLCLTGGAAGLITALTLKLSGNEGESGPDLTPFWVVGTLGTREASRCS
jgi:hypothetical protein